MAKLILCGKKIVFRLKLGISCRKCARKRLAAAYVPPFLSAGNLCADFQRAAAPASKGGRGRGGRSLYFRRDFTLFTNMNQKFTTFSSRFRAYFVPFLACRLIS